MKLLLWITGVIFWSEHRFLSTKVGGEPELMYQLGCHLYFRISSIEVETW